MSKILLLSDRCNRKSSHLCSELSKERHQIDILPLLERLPDTKYDVYSSIILDMRHAQVASKCVNFCRDLKQAFPRPLMVLAENSDPHDKIASLRNGADDYMSEPIDIAELGAKLRALLRRHPVQNERALEVADMHLEQSSCRVRRGNVYIELFPMEFKLLEFFMKHPNTVFSAEVLRERVWGSSNVNTLDTVRTHIKTLRKKINAGGSESLIKTTYGKGYRFCNPQNLPLTVEPTLPC